MNKIVAAIALSMVVSASGQEYGRGRLDGASTSSDGLGRGALPPATANHGYFAGAWGLKLDLGWANLSWDVGPASGSERLFAPQASLFYKTTDNLDVNLSFLHVSGSDEDDILGATKGELTRIALGIRYWVPTQNRVAPFFGGGIGYYLLDGNTDYVPDTCPGCPSDVERATVSVKNAPGAFLEAGLSFLVSDGFFINTGLSYDFVLGSADAKINGRDEDFDIKSFSVNLGVAWKF